MKDSTTSSNPTDHRTQWLSIFSLRLTGYVLLALSALDIVATLVPPDFFNPEWEFRTIGRLVERVPVPLIGLVLVFYGGLRYRRPFEKFFLRPLALLAIAAGIGYLLLIPLSISNSVRLSEGIRQNKYPTQQSLQSNQQLTQFKQLEQQISTASPEKVVSVVTQFKLPISAEAKSDPSSLKAKVLSQIQQNQRALENQLQEASNAQQQQHLKNTVKWVLGALLSGSCLIYLGMGANKFFLLG